MMVFSRSSNWPPYLVPATMSERSSASTRLSARKFGTSPSSSALRQSFDNGSLAHTGFANQHRVVLRAAAQDLDDTLKFAVAANERIKLPVHGGLRKVAAELSQQARFALPRLRRRLLLRYTGQFVANLRQLRAALLQDL